MNDPEMKGNGVPERPVATQWTMTEVVNLLVNQNPFYLISAALVLYGLSAGFGTDDIWINTTIPLTILLAYAAVLAGIALFLIRYGKVWNDVRSILLALMLLFFNLSAALDELLLRGTDSSRLLALGVWVMVPCLVEVLRRGIGIRWPRQFVIVFHLILGLILIYPSMPAYFLLSEMGDATLWAIVAFPVLGALGLLAALPSVRIFARGDWCNNTPWQRLQFIAIGGFALALVARTYLLATAFYPDPGMAVGGFHKLDTPFGGWLCAPILLAVLALCLEYALVTQSNRLRRFALFGAPLVMLISMLGPDSQAFYAMRAFVAAEVASPTFLTGIGALMLGGYACCRRVPQAGASVFMTLLAFSPVGTDTVGLDSLQFPYWFTLALLTAGCVMALLMNRHSLWFIAGTVTFLLMLGSLASEQISAEWLALLIGHLALASMVVCACWFKDKLAKFITGVFAFALPGLAIFALWGDVGPLADLHAATRLIYLAGLGSVGYLLQRCVNREWFLRANACIAMLMVCSLFVEFGNLLDDLKLRGRGRIVAGLCTLALALTISILKARHFRQTDE